MAELIKFEIEAAVAKVTLNRPEVFNSFNQAMSLELKNVLKSVASDGSVRAVYLTGEGRAFCGGQDLAEVAPKAGTPKRDLSQIVRECYNPIILSLRNLEKPVICAVNGVAAGAGANLALACDIVLASKEASFIQAFSKLGLIPDSGGTFILPRLVGLAQATALTMLGEKISAERAVELGLIYKACDPTELQNTAFSMAAELATRPTFGLGLTKRLLNASASNDLERQLTLEAELQGLAGASHDYAEGVAAFLEKRKPNFKGN